MKSGLIFLHRVLTALMKIPESSPQLRSRSTAVGVLLIVLAVGLAGAPPCAGQDAVANGRTPLLDAVARAGGPLRIDRNRTPQSRKNRDAVKNGAIIGAVLGAATAGIFIGMVCEGVKEIGDGPCWKPTLAAVGLGAGGGALLGAGPV